MDDFDTAKMANLISIARTPELFNELDEYTKKQLISVITSYTKTIVSSIKDNEPYELTEEEINSAFGNEPKRLGRR